MNKERYNIEHYLKKDDQYKSVLIIMQVIYVLTAVYLFAVGIKNQNWYDILMPVGTLVLFPVLWAVYRLFKFKKSYQMEFVIFLFTYLGFTLGGAASFYQKFPGFDKLLHTLSGVFVSMLAFALYLLLEKEIDSKKMMTAVFFVFFASMTVAALFEIVEYLAAPLVGRDLQQIAKTGVADTIIDMIVCLIGSLLYTPLLVRFYKGKNDPLTGAVAAFFYINNKAIDA